MPKLKKHKKFSKVTAVKDTSRERIGQPKSSFVIIPKNKRKPKYRDKMSEFFDEIGASEIPSGNGGEW